MSIIYYVERSIIDAFTDTELEVVADTKSK